MSTAKPVEALGLDKNQQKNFIRYFQSLGNKSATTVRFFDRTDYYSLHGEDAYFAAKEVHKSTANVKTMAPGGDVTDVDFVSLRRVEVERLIRELLLVKNYRVEVYVQAKGKLNEWKVEYKGSPGNLMQFEDLLFSNSDLVVGTAIIAIQMKQEGVQKHIGVACIETNERTFSLTDFVDDDFLGELEALVVLLGPKECLLPTVEGDFTRVNEIMKRNGITITPRKKSDFVYEQSDLVQDLNKLLRFEKGQKESAHTILETSNAVTMSSLSAAINYLELINDSSNFGHFEIKPFNLNRFVHLDGAAVTALNLFPQPGTSVNSPAYKWHSILGVLDRCRTPQGHRLIAQWIKQPLRNIETICDRHEIVECLVDGVSARCELYDVLMKRIPDILVLTKKLMRKNASLKDIHRLYTTVVRASKLLPILTTLENKTVNSVIVDPMMSILRDLKNFKNMVVQTIDFNLIDRGEFMIRSTFDPDLAELSTKMRNLEIMLEKQLNKAADDLGLDKGSASGIKLDYVSHIGYHFRTTTKNDAILRNKSKYTTIDVVKGGVRFTTDKLSELNADYIEARASYEEQQKTIVTEIVQIAVGYMVPFTCLNSQIAELDCLLSFAVSAASAPIPYVKPKMHPEGEGIFNLKKLRHPCLELQETVTYIPNDIYFKKDDTNMYIITGPNMGGKSTYIRSFGVAVLMALVGSFVPCDEAEITLVDSILGRIGTGDNFTKGMSTFMLEMVETATIMRTATPNSLVIIDELGRGTSTFDGCGIAWAIAEHLASKTKCYSLFATHFHEICELEKTVTTVKNCHMVAIAEEDSLTLLYQVKPGPMDRSFGIHVAKLAEFPKEVIDMATQFYNETENEYTRFKDAEDEALFQDVMDGYGDVDPDDEAAVLTMMDNIKKKIKESKSEYFSSTYPQIFN